VKLFHTRIVDRNPKTTNPPHAPPSDGVRSACSRTTGPIQPQNPLHPHHESQAPVPVFSVCFIMPSTGGHLARSPLTRHNGVWTIQ
jgi:hypothetical protein